MGVLIGEVFNVCKRFATTKSINIGDFKTKEEAVSAMLEHYKTNTKRGNFSYVVSQCELEEIGGTIFRRTTIGGNDFYKKYSKEELVNMLMK